MDAISKIIAEIERRMKINQWNHSAEGSEFAFSEDKEILSFIESLEKEKRCKFQEYLNASPAERRKFDLSFLGDEIKLTREELNEICGLPRKDVPKIKGWVARDEDGVLRIGEYKPERGFDRWKAYGENIELSKEYFPALKWADEPIEVELTIHRV